MTQFAILVQETETAPQYAENRFIELADQHWDRNKSAELAQREGVSLTDEHWAVIMRLRRYYIEYGQPKTARILVEALNRHFSILGGDNYLHKLFPGGPVTQGSRFANLHMPVITNDDSFGNNC